ncbi:uncharacterized protein LOC105231017 [Bactrocera dorsalis]|uniref:Uncharacterized protein LOC105231017 n=1 Tax=Bactrocera dorsalis TaxID=27457 RepID=A0A6I9VJL8_BACDO|nr:uncharacterized protein LOC105231017 [Bactrocera dorsalis]XP_049306501.1 uncharacterized protein LOC105231017 [Bactrocera dorsalis]
MRQSSSLHKRGYFHLSDEKFVRRKPKKKESHSELQTYQFKPYTVCMKPAEFRVHELPIEFKVTPDTLLNLASKVVDALPLPKIYDWTNADCCKWMREYGYPEYQNTLRVNLITGRKLLLLDAQALVAINIKIFSHIQHIAAGIRELFWFEMTKFLRSISLPPQYYYEMYKLFKVKTGYRYDNTRRTDLWRQLQMLRKNDQPATHWDLLERWLQLKPATVELIGGVRRRNLYRCAVPCQETADSALSVINFCKCDSICTCEWAEISYKKPTVLTVLRAHRVSAIDNRMSTCKTCLPPCTCHWPSRYFKSNDLLQCLKRNFPVKYGADVRTRSTYGSNAYRASFASYSSNTTSVRLLTL